MPKKNIILERIQSRKDLNIIGGMQRQKLIQLFLEIFVIEKSKKEKGYLL